MKRAAVITLTLWALMPVPASADQQTIRLKVSATVLPRACEYPEPCEEMAGESIQTEQTKVTIDSERIRYIGPRPVVGKKDGLMTVMF